MTIFTSKNNKDAALICVFLRAVADPGQEQKKLRGVWKLEGYLWVERVIYINRNVQYHSISEE